MASNVPDYNPNKPTLYVGWSGYRIQEFSYTLASDMDKCGYYAGATRIEGWTPILENASFKFGQAIENSVVHLFREGVDPVDTFNVEWGRWLNVPLHYGERDESWNNLLQVGRALLRNFSGYHKTLNWNNVEFGKKLVKNNWYKGADLVYIADVIVDFPGRKQMVDIKTSASSYPDPDKDESIKGWPSLDPQLCVGALVSEIRNVAFLNLVKTKTPKIQFIEGYVSDYRIADIDDWLKEQFDKLVAKKFYRRAGFKFPNNHCTFCDLLPKCLGNQKGVDETLKQKTKKDTTADLAALDALGE
jgi:hypothetical protein